MEFSPLIAIACSVSFCVGVAVGAAIVVGFVIVPALEKLSAWANKY